MKNRFKWLHVLLTPSSFYERHGGEVMARKARVEQPHGPLPHPHAAIEYDAAQPSPAQPGTMAPYRIALPRRG